MRVALALPLSDERHLVDTAAFHGHEVVARCSGGDELSLRLALHPAELAIVAASPEHLTARLVASADLRGVRLLVVAGDASQEAHARRLGILEVATGGVDWSLLDAPTVGAPAGADAAEASPPPEGEPGTPPGPPRTRRATTIAVWGPSGAPGRTSVAIALAGELAAAGLRVVLADADTHAASVAPALGLLDEAPGFAAACRLAGLGGLDAAQVERLAVVPTGSRHPFRVLTGIGRPARWPELGEERVAAALAALRRECDVLVVDVAASLERDDELASDVATPRRNAAGLEVLRTADRVVALAAADPVGIPRFLRAHAELLELVEPDRVTVVVNKLRPGAIGINPGGQVRQTLARFGGVEHPLLVPWDPAAFDAAVLSGRPLGDAAPRSATRMAIRGLAERLVPEAVGGRRRGRGRRTARSNVA